MPIPNMGDGRACQNRNMQPKIAEIDPLTPVSEQAVVLFLVHLFISQWWPWAKLQEIYNIKYCT